ncbi:MAG TPA: hypothetical protein VGI39_44005 [Polyangiaceae bacterium]|jgi:hypothetical protein
MLAALTSGFIALSALAASIYNVYLQRKQIQAQVWPHLEWTYSDGEDFTFNLENSGVGPAKIIGLRVTVNGTPVKNWREALAEASKSDPELKAFLANPDVRFGYSSIYGRVLGAGVRINPVRFHWAGKDPEAHLSSAPVVRLFDELEVSICYCSTLDECEMDDHPVKECPRDQLTFRQ